METEEGSGKQLEADCGIYSLLYFPDTEITKTDRRTILINQLLPFFVCEEGQRILISATRSLSGDISLDLDVDNLLPRLGSHDLSAAIEIQPSEALNCIKAAIHSALLCNASPDCSQYADVLTSNRARISLQPYNYRRSLVSIAELKSTSIGQLATIKGTIVRCGALRPQVEAVGFSCPRCSAFQRLNLQAGLFSTPSGCEDGCRARQFVLQRDSATLLDWQKLRLQEHNSAGLVEDGRAPRTIEVELTKDLTALCSVGDDVEIMGLVKVTSTDAKKGGRQAERCLYLLYLEAVSIRRAQPTPRLEKAVTQEAKRSQEPPAASKIGTLLTSMDLQAIQRFSQESAGTQFPQLIHSFCPSIFGYAMIKAGLLLALFGGSGHHGGAGGGPQRRTSIHLLMCGDPGLGKSQLLQAASAIAPRGVYICGTTSSSAGLTASVVRDSMSGEYMCEAGALVLADQGICCIDEFDKLTSEHQAILGAMEQQEVTIAKGGICATLPARTTVLAAANPAGGHFDRSKTLAENLKMSAAMLSRFDLSFLLSDKPNQAWDQHLSEHVIAAHSGMGRSGHASKRQRTWQCNIDDEEPDLFKRPCHAWLQPMLEDEFETIPLRFIQTYIAYARTNVHPTLSVGAKQVLKAYYTRLRDPQQQDGLVVTVRQLESLIRLTEARARADLRTEATERDAEEIVSLMTHALESDACASGPTGGRKGGRGKQAEARRLLEGLARLGNGETSVEVTVREIFSMADKLEIDVPDLSLLIEKLNEAGELLKRGNGKYAVRASIGRMHAS